MEKQNCLVIFMCFVEYIDQDNATYECFSVPKILHSNPPTSPCKISRKFIKVYKKFPVIADHEYRNWMTEVELKVLFPKLSKWLHV